MESEVDITEPAFSTTRIRLGDLMELTKFRISVFVVMSTCVGFVLGSEGLVDLLRLTHTLMATFLIASGASALNQLIERDRDSQMHRTADRPLPSRRLQPDQAYRIGVAFSAVGLAYMGLWVNGLTALVAGLTSVIYLFCYTPLKLRSSLNTAVGAVSGALPPLGGWTAASGELGWSGWALFGILFLWQFPHFYAISWIYRQDYARAGYRMLSLDDDRGSRTARQVVGASLILVPVSLVPLLLGMAGWTYLCVASLVGLGLVGQSIAFARSRSDACARRLMRATLIYLPVVWVTLVFSWVS